MSTEPLKTSDGGTLQVSNHVAGTVRLATRADVEQACGCGECDCHNWRAEVATALPILGMQWGKHSLVSETPTGQLVRQAKLCNDEAARLRTALAESQADADRIHDECNKVDDINRELVDQIADARADIERRKVEHRKAEDRGKAGVDNAKRAVRKQELVQRLQLRAEVERLRAEHDDDLQRAKAAFHVDWQIADKRARDAEAEVARLTRERDARERVVDAARLHVLAFSCDESNSITDCGYEDCTFCALEKALDSPQPDRPIAPEPARLTKPLPDCMCGHLWAHHEPGGEHCGMCDCPEYRAPEPDQPTPPEPAAEPSESDGADHE